MTILVFCKLYGKLFIQMEMEKASVEKYYLQTVSFVVKDLSQTYIIELNPTVTFARSLQL